jgi:enolase-phosphatase E1
VSGGPRVVLLDVEGTTTPVDFVYRVLFPYAQARVAAFLDAHAAEPGVAADVAALRAENERDRSAGGTPPAWEEGPAAYTAWLTEQDRKLTALKSLQGRIWAEGFARGELRGQVYPDVPPALRRWTAAGRKVAIFSSGSVLAQKLLFGHSEHGDLAPLLSGYFDTTTGPKREASSYARIADALGTPGAEALFVSDVVPELDAARATGFATALAVRAEPGPAANGHPRITTFDALP